MESKSMFAEQENERIFITIQKELFVLFVYCTDA